MASKGLAFEVRLICKGSGFCGWAVLDFRLLEFVDVCWGLLRWTVKSRYVRKVSRVVWGRKGCGVVGLGFGWTGGIIHRGCGRQRAGDGEWHRLRGD